MTLSGSSVWIENNSKDILKISNMNFQNNKKEKNISFSSKTNLDDSIRSYQVLNEEEIIKVII